MQGRLENELKINDAINRFLEKMPEYVKEWHLNLMASNKTAATRRDFVYKISYFLSFINKDTKNVRLEDFNINKVEEYFVIIRTKKDKNGNTVYTSDSHQQCIWIALNNFFEFLYNRKYISENYMKSITKPKNRDLERINEKRPLLTKKDFKKIINAVYENGGKFKERDLAIITLLMNTGMRESALVEINVSDIDFDYNKLYVVDKGNKKHTYFLSSDIVDILIDYIEERKYFLDDKENDALFLSARKTRITAEAVYDIVMKYSKLGIGKELSPHKLRGGFVTILYKETGDAEFVRRAVGHSNISTTQRYIATAGEEKEKAAKLMQGLLF